MEGREERFIATPGREHQIQNKNRVDPTDFYPWANATCLLNAFPDFILIKAF